jgi:CubicO group peptidase (beta-lactamase class C family)
MSKEEKMLVSPTFQKGLLRWLGGAQSRQRLNYAFVTALLAFAGCSDEVVYTSAEPPLAEPATDAMGHGLPLTTACLAATVVAGQATGTLSGMAAEVVVDDRVVLRYGAGTVGPNASRPVLPSTRFRIASTTKMLTSAALLSLVDRGALRLDSSIADVVPEFSVPGEPGWVHLITPRVLMSQRAALFDYITIDGPRDDGALSAAFRDPAFTANVPLWTAPGTFWNYSNQNLIVAGLMAETAARRPYRELMRESIFRPLGMTRAVFRPEEVLVDNDYALGIDGQTVYAPADYDNAWARPSGWTWASADDLMQFARFLLSGNPAVLSQSSWSAMQSPQVNMATLLDLQSYGYGLFVDSFLTLGNGLFYPGVKVVSHGGNLPGYTTLLSTLPAQRFGFVAMANGSGLDLTPCLRVAIVETVSARLPPSRPVPDLDIQRARFASYAGTYQDRVGIVGPAEVTLDGDGDLQIRFPILDQLQISYEPELSAVSRDNFVVSIQGFDFQMTGFRQGGEAVQYLRTRPFVLRRGAASAMGRSSSEALPNRDAVLRALREAASETSAQSSLLLSPR